MCVFGDYETIFFFFSMSNTAFTMKRTTGQAAPNSNAKIGLPTSLTLICPQISRPKHRPIPVSRPNHAPTAVTRSNHLSAAASLPNHPSTAVSQPSHLSRHSYSRYSKTHSSTSSKLPKIHEKGESNTGVPAHKSTEICLSSEYVSFPDKIYCSDIRDSVSPWDTLGQCNMENGVQLFSIREFLEQCSPSLEEDLCENSRRCDSPLKGRFQKHSTKGIRRFPNLLCRRGFLSSTNRPSVLIT